MKSKFIEEMKKRNSAIHNFSIVYDIAIKSQWMNVEDDLPDIDEYVLFQYENGWIRHCHIDKDMGDCYIQQIFLMGDECTGPIVRWMRVPDHE